MLQGCPSFAIWLLSYLYLSLSLILHMHILPLCPILCFVSRFRVEKRCLFKENEPCKRFTSRSPLSRFIFMKRKCPWIGRLVCYKSSLMTSPDIIEHDSAKKNVSSISYILKKKLIFSRKREQIIKVQWPRKIVPFFSRRYELLHLH